jgi:hypothetical protein
MSDNNISAFPRPTPEPADITLDSVLQSLASWRATKTSRSEPIPDDIWKSIFSLEARFPDLPVHSIFGIPKTQYQRKRDESQSSTVPTFTVRQPRVDFCEAKEEQACYQPARIPATNTLVVEFCRADGKIMKIHTTTDSFAELMKAFFTGA